MLKIYVVLILLISPTFAISQGMLFEGGNNINRGVGLLETTPVILNETYKGSPYITEHYSAIKLNKLEGEIFTARYNAANDAIEVLAKGEQPYNLLRDPNLDVTFLDTNQKYRIFYYKNQNNSNRNGYFVVLNDDEIKLLKKEIINFYDEKLATTSYDRAEPARFKRENDKFYFQQNNVFVTEIERNKKDFIKSLNFDSNKKEQILSFIKKNRIKLNDEEGLISLFKYINSL